MQKKLVGLYEILKQVNIKRKHIQRRNIFSETVFGYSLENIAKNDEIKRSNIYTDNTKYISDIDIINTQILNTLNKSGYYRLSDIALSDKSVLKKETELPNNAVSELYDMATSDYNVPYIQTEEYIETQSKKDVVESLINSEWKLFILFEYSLLIWLQSKTKSIYINGDFRTKNDLILSFKESLDEPRNHVEAIAFCTNTSEKYVRDVLSGRIKNGLNNKEREEILERDNYMCRLCSSSDSLEIHHIIPVANGGGKYSNNLCTLCSSCHFNVAHGRNTSTISYNSQKEFWEDIIDK